MSFENIQLPPFLLQDLYRNYLIDDRSTPVFSDTLKNAEITSSTANKKNILILINEVSQPEINQKDLTLLEGILKACNLTLADISLVNLNTIEDTDYTRLTEKHEPTKILLFGVTPGEIKLPLLFPHNQIQQHASRLYVSFPALEEIASDKSLKQALWGTVQKLFNLK